MMEFLPDSKQRFQSRLCEILTRSQIIPTDIILYDRINCRISILSFTITVLNEHRVKSILTDLIKLQIIFRRCKHSHFQIKMMFLNFLLKHIVMKTKLDKFEIIHKLLILTNILDNIILVLINLQKINNLIQFLQLINITSISFLTIQSTQYFYQSMLIKMF